jgi:hypothetical protein
MRVRRLLLAATAGLAIGASSVANAQLVGFATQCNNTVTCSGSCPSNMYVVTGYCLIPGHGENGSGALQNLGVINNQWVCTYESKVTKIEAWAGCLPVGVGNRP